MPSETQGLIMQELVRRSNEDTRRLRSIEQRLEGVEARLIALEDGTLEKLKKSNAKFAELEASIKTASDIINQVQNLLEKMNRQLSTFARKQDLKEIEHMLDLISPIREEFVTRGELEDELKLRKIKHKAPV